MLKYQPTKIHFLLLLSLMQGKKGKVGDDISMPLVAALAVRNLPEPACIAGVVDIEHALWVDEVVLTKGGAAGKGPDAPQAPEVNFVSGQQEYPMMGEEIDGGEIEGKTKMAFAKMQIPQDLRNNYLLMESDFALSESTDLEEDSTVAAAAAEEEEKAVARASLDAQMSSSLESASMLEVPVDGNGLSRPGSSKSPKTAAGSPKVLGSLKKTQRVTLTEPAESQEKEKKPAKKLHREKEGRVVEKAAQLGLYA